MPQLDYHTIVERFHTFQNPTSEEKLDRLIAYCGIADGQKVLDIGCGKAWLLRRMGASFAIEGTGIEVRASFAGEARRHMAALPGKGKISLHTMPALEFRAAAGSFDVATCIGASFAIGTFEQMLEWIRPFVRPGGVLAVGDIYAKCDPLPPESAVHFSGGKHRTLADTADALNRDGLTLTGVIDASLDDWDRYESLHWHAADVWLRENASHPERDDFARRSETYKLDHIRFDRDALGWAMFVCRMS